MNLGLLALKGHEVMVKEASKKSMNKIARDVQRPTGYDFALDVGRPLDLGVGAQRSGESARSLAMSLNAGDAAYKGALGGAAFTALTGFPAYTLLTRKGRGRAKAALKHDKLLLTKAFKNLSSPKAIAAYSQYKDQLSKPTTTGLFGSPKPIKDPLKNLTTNRELRKGLSALEQVKKKRNIRRLMKGGLAGAGFQIGLNALGNLAAYETGRGLAPKGVRVKQTKQVRNK